MLFDAWVRVWAEEGSSGACRLSVEHQRLKHRWGPGWLARVRLFLSFCAVSAFVQSLNRSVTVVRAMVIGKTADMYEELFEHYVRVAAANGLGGPQASGRESGGGARVQRTPYISITMDFETGQHIGCFRALARVYGGQSVDYHGRVVGCGVHFKRFLLGPCGNDMDDRFFIQMRRLRERETEHGIVDVRTELTAMAVTCEADGESRKANVIRWLLQNEHALMAAFPRCTGVLRKCDLLASYSGTNTCESLNRQIKQFVSEKRASTLMDVVAALSHFDHDTMESLTTPGRVVPTGESQTARMGRAAGRRRRSNVVPAAGQLPEAARRRRQSRQVPNAVATAAPGGEQLPRSDSASPPGPVIGGPVVAAGTATDAEATTLLSASLVAEFQAYLSARAQGGRSEGGPAGASAPST